jgi:pyruvate/2-oxoglutarate/acetoin dehydrogenase E1 component
MEMSPSTRFCNRARTTERGFALALALIVAVLYFGLMELMLIDASRELNEARRFRARVIAATLAENGAELAASHLASTTENPITPIEFSDWQGTATGTVVKTVATGKFEINGFGETTGVIQSKAKVYVQGKVQGADVSILFSTHTP